MNGPLLKYTTRFLFRKPFFGKSLIPEDRLRYLAFLLEKTVYEQVRGNVIECGVYRGGSLVELGLTLKRLNCGKVCYGIDTFEGHPYTDEGTIHVQGHLKDTSYARVKDVLQHLRLDNVKLLKGRFSEIFPSLQQETFCFAHLDCDLYRSYKECLSFLYPRMSRGGILFFDDYNSSNAPKCNKAIEGFIRKKDLIILPKKQAYYTIK